MPFVKNPDGTWTATTPDGGLITSSVPDIMVPQSAKDEAQALAPNPYEPAPPAAVSNAPPEVSPPPLTPGPASPLMNPNAGAAPPTDMQNAVAGPGAPPPPPTPAEVSAGQSLPPPNVETAPPSGVAAAPLTTPEVPGPSPVNPAAPYGTPPLKPILINPQAPPPSPGAPAAPPGPQMTYPTEAAPSIQSAVGTKAVIPIGGGSPVKKVPERLVPVGGSMTQVIQQPISPEQQAVEAAARAELIKGIQIGADYSEARLDHAAESMADAKASADAKIASIEEAQRKREAEIAPKIQDLQAQQRSLASMRVDPEHYWHEKSTFGKVVATIAVAFGGFSAGMSGGKNQAYEILNDRINNDINAQKANIDAARGAVDVQTNILAQMRAKWLSPEAAEAATRALLLQSTASEAARQATITQSVDVQNRARDLINQLNLAKEMQNTAAAQAEAGVEQRLSRVQLAHTEGGPAALNVRAIYDQNLKFYSKQHDASEEGKQAAAKEAANATALEVYNRTAKYNRTTGKFTPGINLGVEDTSGMPGSGIPPTGRVGPAGAPAAPGALNAAPGISSPPPGAIPPPPSWMNRKQATEYSMKALEAWNMQQSRYSSMRYEERQNNALKAAGDGFNLLNRLDNWKTQQYNLLSSKHGTAIAGAAMNAIGVSTKAGEKVAAAEGSAAEMQSTILQSFIGKTDQGLQFVAKMFPAATTLRSRAQIDAFYENAANRIVSTSNGVFISAGYKPKTEEEFRKSVDLPDPFPQVAPPPPGGTERK